MSEKNTPRVLGELLAERLERNAGKVFMRFKDQQITYDELDRYSNRCANAFLNLGISKGDKVSIMLPNQPEFIYLWFGLAKIGAVEVPVNTNYKGEFLRHIVDQSDSRILAIGSQYLERLKLIENDLTKLEKVIVLPGAQKTSGDSLKFTTITYDEFFDSPEDAIDIKVLPQDPISIIYTSGTTGLSKGALGPHKFWIVSAERMLEYRQGSSKDIFYTFLPLYHFNAQVLTTLTTLIAEAQMVLADRFSASRF